MLKRNLRLNRQNTLYIILQAFAHQNTLYIILQALACFSLVEWYECFGETCDLNQQYAPCIARQTLACFRMTRKNICVYLRTRTEQQYSFVYGSILCSPSLHDPAEKQLLSHNH
jgi:hypothetical protein